jgi:sugar phosphate isomerase/epimerase
MKLTLGCTTRPFAKVPFAEACQRIAAAGYTDVALFDTVDADSSREETLAARQVALDAGLAPSMLLARSYLDLGLDEAVSKNKRLVDNAVALGARWLLQLGTGDRDLLERYVTLMRQVAPYAQDAGVGIAVKPHGGITTTTDDLIDVHSRVDHPSYSICYDPGNIIFYTKGEERPEIHVARVAPLVTTCIIKDCVVVDGKPDVMVTPGEGWVDFDAVLSALVAGGFQGPLYVECVGGQSVQEIGRNVRDTHAFLQAILDRLPRP